VMISYLRTRRRRWVQDMYPSILCLVVERMVRFVF
jgi:hypothetical protein